MDLYVFAQEAGSAGIEDVRDVDTVRLVIPTAGEYAAYAALADDDPRRVFAGLAAIRDVEDVLGVDAFVPLSGDAGRIGDLGQPLPMPTRIDLRLYVAFVLVTTEPCAAAEVYAAIAAGRLAGAAAIVAGQAPTVLAEVTADTREELAAAIDRIGSLPRVRDLGTSVGLGPSERAVSS